VFNIDGRCPSLFSGFCRSSRFANGRQVRKWTLIISLLLTYSVANSLIDVNLRRIRKDFQCVYVESLSQCQSYWQSRVLRWIYQDDLSAVTLQFYSSIKWGYLIWFKTSTGHQVHDRYRVHRAVVLWRIVRVAEPSGVSHFRCGTHKKWPFNVPLVQQQIVASRLFHHQVNSLKIIYFFF
jgi:hypothetical protein